MDNYSYCRLFLLFLISLSLYNEGVSGSTLRVRCIEKERQALLLFKQGVVDDHYAILSSWSSQEDNKECCKWFGVKCSNKTGHVIALDLHAVHGILRGSKKFKINNLEGLSQLRLLRQLDLSYSRITANNWLQVIVNLPFLETLNLSGCRLGLIKPSTLLLPKSSSESLSNLDLSANNLTSSSTWLFHISKRLVSINLSENNFNSRISDAFGELIFLEDIDLSYNSFEGGIPNSFQNLSHLRSLSLANNQNVSESFSKMLQKLSKGAEKTLEILDLSQNQFYGPLNDLTRFSSLRELYLSENNFNGSLMENFLLPPNLEHFDLSTNQIMGKLSIRSLLESLSQTSKLEYLDLSDNQVSELHLDMASFSSLRVLRLNNNTLRSIPESIGQLSNLEILDISSNFMEGTLSEVHFSRLSNLEELYLSFNALVLNISFNWVPPFQLDVIGLSNCSVGPHFPQWLKSQNKFSILDLDFCGISDALPNWFWDLSPKLVYLNMSHNQISGRLPELSNKFHGYPSIDLTSNNFYGPILSLPSNLSSLLLPKNLFVGSISFLCVITGDFLRSLDLSDNQFSEDLPNCWMNMKSLEILNLANNNFSGEIPTSFGFLHKLETLHLRNNSFIGKIPSSLKNCSELEAIDIGGNRLTGNIPSWVGTHLTTLAVLSLSSNQFYGNIPQEICYLSRIQILDLSHNNIIGAIPHCFWNFTYLVQQNVSAGSITFKCIGHDVDGFNFKGHYEDNVLVQWKRQEREYKKTLGYLKVIDLSSNKLVGEIPQEFETLRALHSLNLSSNHLTGNIIEHVGQMASLESLDLSRNKISGKIPRSLTDLKSLVR